MGVYVCFVGDVVVAVVIAAVLLWLFALSKFVMCLM